MPIQSPLLFFFACCLTAAPMVKTQPGFYRMMLGDFEITALNDCVVAYPSSTITGATPDQIRSGLAEMRLTDPVEMSYNAFLINTGAKLILIDTGTGGKVADTPGFQGCGHLPANLRAAGLSAQPDRRDLHHPHRSRSRRRTHRRQRSRLPERHRPRRAQGSGPLSRPRQGRREKPVERVSPLLLRALRQGRKISALRWRHPASARNPRARDSRTHARPHIL